MFFVVHYTDIMVSFLSHKNIINGKASTYRYNYKGDMTGSLLYQIYFTYYPFSFHFLPNGLVTLHAVFLAAIDGRKTHRWNTVPPLKLRYSTVATIL